MRTTARSIGDLSAAEELLEAIDGFLSATSETKDWPKLSESEYVDRILRFASARPDEHAEELFDTWFELVFGTTVPQEERGGGVAGMGTKLYEDQAQLIEWLEIVRTGRQTAIQKLKSVVSEAGDKVIIRPAFVEQDGKLTAEYRFFPTSIQAAFGYGLLLILDEDRGYSICRCKYSECLRYFLATEPENGRPRRVYCSTEHLDAARRAEGTERMRRTRSKQRQTARSTRRRQK